ncbi:hypothetical protein JTE90_012646 [Oedothorax gibbosus]|uniref:Uncharacterized protein n=1 Tax=Oedothorax gibbosus TaxID=931172 RepID=A0AAV6TGP9_9ARAC|nr:hypothetical protein JTE90_012646 [Oedothorax gibbosus]
MGEKSALHDEGPGDEKDERPGGPFWKENWLLGINPKTPVKASERDAMRPMKGFWFALDSRTMAMEVGIARSVKQLTPKQLPRKWMTLQRWANRAATAELPSGGFPAVSGGSRGRALKVPGVTPPGPAPGADLGGIANTQVRPLRTEVEKGFHVNSILKHGSVGPRDRRNPFRSETSAETQTRCVFLAPTPKNGGLKFPQPDTEIGPSGAKCGNATQLGACGGPGEELSFFCKIRAPGKRSSGDRDCSRKKHPGSWGSRGALFGPFKIRGR